MATTPSEPGGAADRRGYGGSAGGGFGRNLPVAGNTELIIYLLVWLIIALIWLFSDEVGPADFATLTVALTFGYLISRGIAKAGRVDEASVDVRR